MNISLTRQATLNLYKENINLIQDYIKLRFQKHLYTKYTHKKHKSYDTIYTKEIIRKDQDLLESKIKQEGLSIQAIRKALAALDSQLRESPKSESKVNLLTEDKHLISGIILGLSQQFIEEWRESKDRNNIYLKTQKCPIEKQKEYKVRQTNNSLKQLNSEKIKQRTENQRKQRILKQKEQAKKSANHLRDLKQWIINSRPPLFSYDNIREVFHRYSMEMDAVFNNMNEKIKDQKFKEKFFNDDKFSEQVVNDFVQGYRIRQIKIYETLTKTKFKDLNQELLFNKIINKIDDKLNFYL